MVQDESAPAAAMSLGSGILVDRAAAMASTSGGSDYDLYGRNSGLYLGETNDLGISDDLSSLDNNQDTVNRGCSLRN